MISVYGPGFIGGRFCEMYPSIPIERDQREPKTNKLIYFISTTHNYDKYTKDGGPYKISHDVRVNLDILSQVLETLSPDHEFNFISSWFVLAGVDIPAKEDGVGSPRGNYSLTKKMAEELVTVYCESHRIPYRIFRLANIFGPGDNFSPQKNALQYLIDKLKRDEDIYLYYNGVFFRDYLYIDDCCRMLYEGMEKLPVNDIYHIGCGHPVLFSRMIKIAKEVIGSSGAILPGEPTEFHKKVQVKDFWLNTNKTQRYGIIPSKTPYEWLEEMLNEG